MQRRVAVVVGFPVTPRRTPRISTCNFATNTQADLDYALWEGKIMASEVE
jgi:hypothetical protein